jgi:hypothetical protein
LMPKRILGQNNCAANPSNDDKDNCRDQPVRSRRRTGLYVVKYFARCSKDVHHARHQRHCRCLGSGRLNLGKRRGLFHRILATKPPQVLWKKCAIVQLSQRRAPGRSKVCMFRWPECSRTSALRSLLRPGTGALLSKRARSRVS